MPLPNSGWIATAKAHKRETNHNLDLGKCGSGAAKESDEGERRKGQKERPRGAAAGQQRFAGAVVIKGVEAKEASRP